jgi:hypothetical protein
VKSKGTDVAPIGGAVSFVIIIVGIIAVVIVRYRRR